MGDSSMKGLGPLRPIAESEWRAEGVREDLVRVLRTWGPGALAGVFAIPDPREGAWEGLREEALRWHERGHWAGLLRRRFEKLVVFARDRRGCALACDGDGYVFLGPEGVAFEVGQSLDELVHGFLLGGLSQTYAATRGIAVGSAWESGADLGCEAVFVTEGAPGLEDYLASFANGGDGDLSVALGAQPVVLAYVETVAALCSRRAETIPDDVRASEIATVLRLAKRRMPGVSLFPDGIPGDRPFASPEVRAWADGRATLGPFGPFGNPGAQGSAEEVVLEAPLHLPVYWPRVDPSAWAEAVEQRCRGTMLEALAAERRRAFELLPWDVRFGLVRQLTQLDEDVVVLEHDQGGAVRPDARRARAESAETRIGARAAQFACGLALAVLGGAPTTAVRATRALGKAAPRPLWLALLAGTSAPMPWGADTLTFAEAALAAGAAGDAEVEALLPALRAESPAAAVLLSSRLDRADVREALLGVYPRVALASAWTSDRADETTLTESDEAASAALASFLGLDATRPPLVLASMPPAAVPELRQRWRPSGNAIPHPRVNPRMQAPFRPGPLGPITRALVDLGGRAALEVLAKTVNDAKADLDVRDEALKGLQVLGAPGTDALADRVAKSWERYWRI